MTVDVQEFHGNKAPKKSRIKSDALHEEREAAMAILRDDPDAQILAVATDLDIPLERMLKYWIEWQAMKSKSSVIRFSMILGILKDKFKAANGEPLNADTPISLEFEDNRVIITPYEKSAIN